MTTLSATRLILARDHAGESAPARVLMIALTVVVFAVAAFSRLSYLTHPFDPDGAMFAYMGKLVVDGGRFGEDLIDNKFPTVGLLMSVFWRSFGSWWPGYVISQLLLTIVAAGVLSRQAARSFGEHARVPTLLVSVCLLNLNGAVMGGFQLETIQAFFGAIAAACGLAAFSSLDRRDALASGLACGCAMLTKPTGAGVFGALMLGIAIGCLASPRSRQRQLIGLALSAGLGLTFPLLCAISYLHHSDQLTITPAIASQIAEYARNSSFATEDLFRPFSILGLFIAAIALRAWVYRRRGVEVNVSNHLALWAFAVAWLAIEFVGVLMQRRMYAYHFLPLAAPAAVVFAAIPRQPTVGQLAGVLAIPLILSIWGARDVLAAADRRHDTAPAFAAWLDARTAPGERVWRDITAQILVRGEFRSASRMQLTFLFMNSDDAPARFSSMLLNDLRKTRATYVVLPTDLSSFVKHQSRYVAELSRLPRRRENFAAAWKQIHEFVRDRYTRVHLIGNEAVWMLKEEGHR